MHPLELPELLHRVGWFMTTWKPSKKSADVFDFYPKDLIACVQVNHTWRRVMLPLLWTVYDEGRMEGWEIPGDILQASSEHFRFISLGTPWPANTVRSAHLQELRIAGRALVNNLQLLRDNPQLTSLTIWFSDRAMYNELQPAIESLTRLQSFYLDFLRPENWDHLTRVFNSNPDLRSVAFRHPHDIMSFEGCEPLGRLTLLHFTGDWSRNPGILQLIQLCPRLERLEFLATGCPVKLLVAVLRMSCPFLNAIQCDGNLDDEEGASLLLQAATRLLHLKLTVTQFSAQVCGALMGHAEWLESLKLHLREDHEVNSRSLAYILNRCTNLRSLEIVNAIDLVYPDPRLNWIDSPWNVPHLESISLLGLTYPFVFGAETSVASTYNSLASPRSRAQRQAAVVSSRGLAQSSHDEGWAFDRCNTVGYDDMRISDSARAIRDAVLRRVSDSPRMHKILIEDFTYVNKGRVPLKR